MATSCTLNQRLPRSMPSPEWSAMMLVHRNSCWKAAAIMLAILNELVTRPHFASDETCLSMLAGGFWVRPGPLMLSMTA